MNIMTRGLRVVNPDQDPFDAATADARAALAKLERLGDARLLRMAADALAELDWEPALLATAGFARPRTRERRPGPAAVRVVRFPEIGGGEEEEEGFEPTPDDWAALRAFEAEDSLRNQGFVDWIDAEVSDREEALAECAAAERAEALAECFGDDGRGRSPFARDW